MPVGPPLETRYYKYMKHDYVRRYQYILIKVDECTVKDIVARAENVDNFPIPWRLVEAGWAVSGTCYVTG